MTDDKMSDGIKEMVEFAYMKQIFEAMRKGITPSVFHIAMGEFAYKIERSKVQESDEK